MRTGQGCRRRPTFEASAASRCLAWAGCRREPGISCGNTGQALQECLPAMPSVALTLRTALTAVVIGGGAGPLRPVQVGVGHQRVPLGLRGDRLVSMAPVRGLPGDSRKPGQWPLRRVSVRRMRQPGARACRLCVCQGPAYVRVTVAHIGPDLRGERNIAVSPPVRTYGSYGCPDCYAVLAIRPGTESMPSVSTLDGSGL
jgi:hypothetical protein